jgi:hypothetical protein
MLKNCVEKLENYLMTITHPQQIHQILNDIEYDDYELVDNSVWEVTRQINNLLKSEPNGYNDNLEFIIKSIRNIMRNNLWSDEMFKYLEEMDIQIDYIDDCMIDVTKWIINDINNKFNG